MISEISSSAKFTIRFEEFRAMRLLELKCELNVISEFKKFAINKFDSDIIDADCIKEVLLADDQSEDQIEEYLNSYPQLSAPLGQLFFKDLYNQHMKLVPEDWLDWIFSSLLKDVSPITIL